MRDFIAGTAILAAALVADAAQAQPMIKVGCAATSDCGSAMVGVDAGIFKRHGLDVELVLIGINSNTPAAILSNSIQISGPTSTVFLRVVEGGLDLVAVGARYAAELSRTEPIIFCAASRDWAENNRDAITKFREGIADAATIVNADRDKASAAIAKFTSRQPREMVKIFAPNTSEPVLKSEQLKWWIDVLQQQNMLQSKVDLDRLDVEANARS